LISIQNDVLISIQGLGYGLFDGITGLVTQPVKGAQEGGVGGFFMGLGKGIGGAVFKPAAGKISFPRCSRFVLANLQ
jgi:hypothetical protein